MIDIKDYKALEEAAKIILAGGLVIFPSDTVYILAVDPTNEKGVKKLLEFKNRWTGKAVSVAVSDQKMAEEYVVLNENSKNIYKNLLPGPFTIVSEGKHKVATGIEAENGTLGIRIPDNKYIHDLVDRLGKPVTATSANLSGRTPNYSVQSLLRPLSKKKKEMIDLIVDGGKLAKNKPSTVIDATESEIKILRRGDLITGKTTSLISKSEKETEKIAEFLLRRNPPVDKSTSSLKEGRKSLEKNWKFLHMDLYKITSEKDLEEIKFLDLFEENTVSCIEWPEQMGENYLKKLREKTNVVSVNFEYVDEKTREIRY